MCFAVDGETLYSAVDDKPKRTRELRRLRNVAENPRTALIVDEWHEDWSRLCWVLVEGRADVLRTGVEFDRAVELLRGKYPQYRAMNLHADGAVLRVRAERIVAWRAAD